MTFNSAPNQICIPISILNDTVDEVTELFTVILGTADRAVIFTQPSADVFIIDVIGKHQLSLGLVTVTHCIPAMHIVCSWTNLALDSFSFTLMEEKSCYVRNGVCTNK